MRRAMLLSTMPTAKTKQKTKEKILLSSRVRVLVLGMWMDDIFIVYLQ